MNTCQRIEPHLSALMDGELEPLEIIAIRRHLDRCIGCAHELKQLESLKVTTHLAGQNTVIHPSMRSRLRAVIPVYRPALYRLWAPSFLAACTLICMTWFAWPSVHSMTPNASVIPVISLPQALDEGLIERVVDAHRRRAGSLGRSTVALIALERIPVHFIDERRQHGLVQASFGSCQQVREEATLAVLDVRKMILPGYIEERLARDGVYVDVHHGVEVRVSVSGNRVFVLASNIDSATSI
jgi:hypothetical protein